ncbi:MAG: hypothetical protein CMJ27_02350 [Phycisphaerae bacterium]|nr:hypothetical protein [Phycisphaerae bacterium]OUX02793.1 MAG: hypothetical protein CBD91_01680 [Phycisphaeraceae bacterium TMED231]
MDAARDPFEELTDLFLSDDPTPDASEGDATSATVASPAESKLTIAICGHLPVMAGLWVTQYADRVAEAHGSTGLVRLEGGRCSVEIFRSSRRVERPQGVDLATASGVLAEGIRRWVVCVDDRDAAEAVRAGADEVVILTAAERPAVIEAYRLAKSAAARVAAEHPLDLGLVVVGADEDRASGAAGVLSEAASRHLDRPFPVVATVRRLDVVEGSQRIMFEESVRRTAQEVVTSIRAALDVEGFESPEPVSTPTPSAGDAAPDGVGLRLAGFEESIDHDDPPKTVRPAPVRRTGIGMQPLFPGEPPKRAGVRPVRLGPAPTGEAGVPAFRSTDESPASEIEASSESSFEDGFDVVEAVPAGEAAATGSSEATDWSRWIDGISVARFRCPIAPEVEFGLDEDGRLHLLCGHSAIESMRVAEAWLRTNRDLVALATGFTGDVVLHVFTRDAPAVADLHRTGIRLHLLVDEGEDGRCLPLNTASNASTPA